MTIEEAEEYYKRYLGQGFHMGRDEPGKYEYFKRLELPKETFIKWDHELLEHEYEILWKNPFDVWVHQGNILTIIMRRNCNVEEEISRLLDEMTKMDQLSDSSLAIVIEHMAGTNYNGSDGGVCFIYKYTKQANHMIQVMNGLINKNSSHPRYKKAIEMYKSSCSRYYHR